jgi:hypothetical protein
MKLATSGKLWRLRHRFKFRYAWKHMKNIKNEEKVPDAAPENQQNGSAINSLPKMEMYAVLGLELSKKILELIEETLKRVEKVENSVEIIATQKARELNPDQPTDPKED